MRRNININDISDGRFYAAFDLVKAGCDDCKGCHQCCEGMGKSIILDPYDIYNLMKGLEISFQGLLERYIEFSNNEGIILPNIAMDNKKDERCQFLDDAGRCSIHDIRPGICRLFPLGRIYNDRGFCYFLQDMECPKNPKSEVQVVKWIGIPEYDKYADYIQRWHDLIKNLQDYINSGVDEQSIKNTNLVILNNFYGVFDVKLDFYEQFDIRYNKIVNALGL